MRQGGTTERQGMNDRQPNIARRHADMGIIEQLAQTKIVVAGTVEPYLVDNAQLLGLLL